MEDLGIREPDLYLVSKNLVIFPVRSAILSAHSELLATELKEMQVRKNDIELDGIDKARPAYHLACDSHRIRPVLTYIHPELQSIKKLNIDELLDIYVMSERYKITMMCELMQEKLL